MQKIKDFIEQLNNLASLEMLLLMMVASYTVIMTGYFIFSKYKYEKEYKENSSMISTIWILFLFVFAIYFVISLEFYFNPTTEAIIYKINKLENLEIYLYIKSFVLLLMSIYIFSLKKTGISQKIYATEQNVDGIKVRKRKKVKTITADDLDLHNKIIKVRETADDFEKYIDFTIINKKVKFTNFEKIDKFQEMLYKYFIEEVLEQNIKRKYNTYEIEILRLAYMSKKYKKDLGLGKFYLYCEKDKHYEILGAIVAIRENYMFETGYRYLVEYKNIRNRERVKNGSNK